MGQSNSTCTVWAHDAMHAHASVAFAMQHTFSPPSVWGNCGDALVPFGPSNSCENVAQGNSLLVLPVLPHSMARMQFCQGKCVDDTKALVLVGQQGQKLTTVKDLCCAGYQHNISSGNGAKRLDFG